MLERELGAHRDPLRKMLVTVIEFESHAMMIGHLGLRVSLIAYPVVSVKKVSFGRLLPSMQCCMHHRFCQLRSVLQAYVNCCLPSLTSGAGLGNSCPCPAAICLISIIVS